MNDVTIIDQFLNTFSAYIDSGFGLLRGEVAFLTATLIVIDMTIAGLYWAMSHATGQGEDACRAAAEAFRRRFFSGQAGPDEYQTLADLPPIPPSFEEPADGMAPAVPAEPKDTP